MAFARPQHAPAIPPEMALRLLPGTVERFRALSAADQRHLLAVGTHLRMTDAQPDLWMAGLLHDIGKSAGGHRVRLWDRVAWVLASRVGPIERMIRAQESMPRFGRGIWIAAHHAELGYTILKELGYNERICTLVAFHADADLARIDPELAELQAADNAPMTLPAPRMISHIPEEARRGRVG
ncbi:MAG: HD domain-containing protein [Thermomicrobiales bacterium]